jgi:two-component system sensor histidine kinase BaeS
MARADRSGPIGLRLALAFVAVALGAVALVGVLSAVFAATEVSHLALEQRSLLTQSIEVAAADSWERNNRRFSMEDLKPVQDLASKIAVKVRVTNQAGTVVASSPGFDRSTGPLSQAPIVSRGRQVGTIHLRFGQVELGSPHHRLRATLWQALASAAGIAALLALIVALVVSRRISKPVERLIEVTRARGHGSREARVGQIRAPAELRELASTFDTMADTMARQEQLRRNLVADVAHELRTPVAVLQAGHEALLDGVLKPTPDQLSSLRDEVARLARMVDDLQTLAAAEAAALQLAVEPGDLAEIAAVAADSMQPRFDTADIALDTKLAPAPVMADDRRVHQVVTNLLSNAVKFTPAGGSVTMEVGQSGGHATLTISDTGIGIPPDELPHISERFWRGSNAADVAGSGIGLAVVAELTWAHHGDLEIMSNPGQGTRVSVSLPLARHRAVAPAR